jgi:prenyltransferase beta subunit
MAVAETFAPPEVRTERVEADLWCTYAAVRTLSWLGRIGDVPDPDGTAAVLAARRNADGGYAWSRGMASDAWATYYCTQALRDLGRPLPGPDRTADWLDRTRDGGAYAMMPGQSADVWATHFSTRTDADLRGPATPRAGDGELSAWLGRLQAPDGGLTWSPADAEAGRPSDARACFYGVRAWQVLGDRTGAAPPWDTGRLVAWLRGRQTGGGGFTFAAAAGTPCLWATYRATGALAALGAGPEDPRACADWIHARRGPAGGFVRWPGYGAEDVWAAFCATGALGALGAPTGEIAPAVAARLASYACPGGGFTYREPEAAMDALTAAAELLSGAASGGRRERLLAWLESCMMPNEDGVMYMPGRGSEVRCTLWALAAGAFESRPDDRGRIAAWLGGLQNPDGGFGYWEGRASDVVSTVSALAVWRLCDGSPGPDACGVARFLRGCAHRTPDGVGYANVPGGPVTLRATLQALRGLRRIGRGVPAGEVRGALDRHRVRSGGWADRGDRVPDLLSTYEAVLTGDLYGIPVVPDPLARLLDRLATPGGHAWTPLAPGGGGPLADTLAVLLRRRVAEPDFRLPELTLS